MKQHKLELVKAIQVTCKGCWFFRDDLTCPIDTSTHRLLCIKSKFSIWVLKPVTKDTKELTCITNQ